MKVVGAPDMVRERVKAEKAGEDGGGVRLPPGYEDVVVDLEGLRGMVDDDDDLDAENEERVEDRRRMGEEKGKTGASTNEKTVPIMERREDEAGEGEEALPRYSRYEDPRL